VKTQEKRGRNQGKTVLDVPKFKRSRVELHKRGHHRKSESKKGKKGNQKRIVVPHNNYSRFSKKRMGLRGVRNVI